MITRRTMLATSFLAVMAPFVSGAAADAGALPELEAPVMMIGDSMMRLLGKAMEKEFKKAGIQPAVAFSSLGSGLVRPSIFNWNSKVTELCAKNRPKTVFVALGTNDRQTLEKEGGGYAEYGKPEWKTEYIKLVTALLKHLKESDVQHVVWMLLPPMKSTQNQEHAVLVNTMIAELVESGTFKEFLSVYDMGAAISSRVKKGKFTQTVMSHDGSSITVRDTDGVHLTFAGGTRIAQDVITTYWKKGK